MRILLAVDSAKTSELAVRQLGARIWPSGTAVEVLCVVEPSYIEEIPQLIEGVKQRADDLVRDTASQIKALGLASTPTVLTGDPKDIIVAHAAETGTDFVLVGAHQGGESSRFLFGSVARAVVRLAPCSVEVLRSPADDVAGPRPMKVLLATDGSECSAQAARSVAGRPWPAGTEIRILSVVELGLSLFHVPFPPAAEETLRAEAMKHTQDAIREAEQILLDAGLPASETISVLLSGTKAIILDEASKWGADLIVLGSHGRRGIHRLLLGSVSEAVAMHAGCSVEIIRAAPVRRSVIPIGFSAPGQWLAETPSQAKSRTG